MTQHLEGFQLSAQQQRLLLLQQGTGAQFCARCAVLIEGKVNPAAILDSLKSIVARHEIFRTRFQRLQGVEVPVQVINDGCSLSYRELMLGGLKSEEQETRLENLFVEARNEPFDMQRGPMLKVTQVILSPQKHVLLIALPSVCADGGTLGNLVAELASGYAAAQGGEELFTKPIQYADYSAWQQALLDQDGSDIARTFWQRQNVLDSAAVKLPSLMMQGQQRPFTPDTFTFKLGPSWSNKIETVAREYAVSADTVLLACWQTLLWRLTGQARIVVGNVFDGRNYEDLYRAMGLFAKTLPIDCRFEASNTFGDLLNQVHESKQNTAAQQEYLFLDQSERLIEDRRKPFFFPVGFEFQDHVQTHESAGVAFSIYKQSCEVDRFQIKMTCVRWPDSLTVDLRYASNLFERADVSLLASQFITLLRGIVKDSRAALTDFELLGESDRHRISIEWNDTGIDYPSAGYIIDFFETQVELTPAASAIVFEDHHVTYAELNRRANQLTHHLRRLGVGPESVVGVCLERSVELIVGLMAVLKAGAAYLPVDPLYPKQRVALMLEESGATVLLTQATWHDQLLLQEAQSIALDRDWESIAVGKEENASVAVSTEQAAYVIYTSGSTGRPKGAVNTHGGLRNRLLWMQEAFHLGPGDRVLQKTPFTFDVSVWEFFWPLITGACLVLARPDGHKDPEYLARIVREEQITTLHFVPSMLQVFLAAAPQVEDCHSLRQVFSSGEALSQSLVQRFFERVNARLHNLYGPTEASIDVTRWSCPRKSEWSAVPIGRPIANSEIYLLDVAGHQVPAGVNGEIHIGGAGVSRGYLNRPDLTAERFVPHDHSKRAGERLYKTGDMARYLKDGEIDYLGRMDQQVKLRGFRIELGEVETVLTEHHGIGEAAVLLKEYSSDDVRLVAYVVPDSRRAPVVKKLLRFQKENRLSGRAQYELPNGMVVVHQNKNETDFMFKEIFEEETYLKHGIIVREGDCIFDVGANIGLFTLSLGWKHKDVTIYAFEPLPPIFEALCVNTALYDLKVKVFDCGLSKESKNETFTYYPFASLLSGRFADAAAERESIKAFLTHQHQEDDSALDALLTNRLASESFTCRLKTLSEVISEHSVQRIDLLKIDVEKGELDVLEGINKADWARIRQLVIEVHDIDDRLSKIKGLLELQGYDVAIEQDLMLQGTHLYNVYARGPSEFRDFSPTNSEQDIETSTLTWSSAGSLLNDVRRTLNEKLPGYMVPSSLVLLEALPLTANGKLDISVLPAPDAEASRRSTFVAPATDIEQTVAAIWQQVLKAERVGVEDNFFDLGGHSFLLIKVYHELRKVFDREFEITEMLRYPTVGSLSRFLAGAGNEQAAWLSDDRTELRHASQNRLKQRLELRQQTISTSANLGY